ncbi:MAG TPA: hypothetical protein VFQ53_37480 [Kofleriaceae bacterium]|nr:hypothetical protein [Kofleriaceae bacterium]
MGRIGFWQLLLDNNISWWERDSINGAYDQAEIAMGQANANAFSLQQLGDRVQQMGREIIMLRAALTVLVNTLRDTNVIDPKLLDARLEAAMEEAFPPPPPQAAAGNAAPQIPPLTCIRCRQQRPASGTSMTADGPVCDACMTRPTGA